MIRTSEGTLLRIFIGDSDRDGGQPLYKVLVRRAHEMGLAGATVLHGPLGFGRHAHLHTAKLADLSTDLPVVIEVVDAEEAVRRYLDDVHVRLADGLVTLERVTLVHFGPPEG